jgi:multidrug resistance efflux pump
LVFPFRFLQIFRITAIPEASIEALKAQLSTLQGIASFPVDSFFYVLPNILLLTFPSRILYEKEQLIEEHRKALDAQKATTRELKNELIQIGLRHEQELKDAKAAAEAQLKEALDDSVNSTAVLRAELEEGGKARKAAEDRVALLEAEQKEYNLLVMQTDGLALRKFLLSGFFL